MDVSPLFGSITARDRPPVSGIIIAKLCVSCAATDAAPCKRGIGFRDAKIRVRGGDPDVIREKGGGWIHVVRHLSDNLTTARLSPPSLRPSYMYSATLQDDAPIPETPRRFFSLLHTSRLFFPRLTNTQHNAEGCEISHVRRVFIIIACDRCAERLSHFPPHNYFTVTSNFAICISFSSSSSSSFFFFFKFNCIDRNICNDSRKRDTLAATVSKMLRARADIPMYTRRIICVDDATDCLCVDTPCVHTISLGALFSAC